MVVATPDQTLSGLGRAMMQRGLLPQRDAEAIRSQAKTARIGFVEQRILGQNLKATEIDELVATIICPGLRELPALDARHMPLKITNGNAIDNAEQARRDCTRDLRQSGLLKVRQGVTSLGEVDVCTNE